MQQAAMGFQLLQKADHKRAVCNALPLETGFFLGHIIPDYVSRLLSV
jgi:hypothetical protein